MPRNRTAIREKRAVRRVSEWRYRAPHHSLSELLRLHGVERSFFYSSERSRLDRTQIRVPAGVAIEDEVMIGAGSLVTKDVVASYGRHAVSIQSLHEVHTA